MRLRRSPAAVAGPILTRRSASSSTTATICCLSGNHEALDYLDRIGARETLRDPGAAIFDFADLKSGERWRLDLSEGRIPWWLFDRKKRVPGTALSEYFAPARRVHEGAERDSRRGDGLRGPALRAALAPAADLGAQHGSPGKLRRAYRRFAARDSRRRGQGLPPALRGPWACQQFHRSGARFSRRTRLSGSVRRPPSGDPFRGESAPLRSTLTGRRQELGADDSVILSVPPWIAKDLLPGLTSAGRISRHSQCSFPDRAASRPTGDSRRRQRTDRMAVRFSRPALSHDQQRRPAHRPSAR